MAQSTRPKPKPTVEPPYPIPSYAANVWVSGDRIHLNFPPSGGKVKGHTVPLPTGNTYQVLKALDDKSKGLRKLLDLTDVRAIHRKVQEMLDDDLRGARQSAATFHSIVQELQTRRRSATSPTIGKPGAPTAADLQRLAGFAEALKRNAERREAVRPKTEEERRAWLKKLGLIH